MTYQIGLFSGRRSIRYPILAIAWIPSLVLLLIGLLVTGVLAYQGGQKKSYSGRFDNASKAAAAFVTATFAERRASETAVVSSGANVNTAELIAARDQLDATLPPFAASVQDLSRDYPAAYAPTTTFLAGLATRLAGERERISGKRAGLVEVSEFYSDISRHIADSLHATTRTQPVAQAASEATVSVTLLRATDELLDADALAAAAFASEGGLRDDGFALLVRREGGARSRFAEAISLLQPDERADLVALQRSQAWIQIENAHAQALLTRGQPARDTSGRGENGNQRGGGSQRGGADREAVRVARPASPPDLRAWGQNTSKVLEAVTAINLRHSAYTTTLSTRQGQAQLNRSLLFGAALLVLAVGAFMATTVASNRIVRRLRRLRSETLVLVNERLPNIIGRLRAGQPVEAGTEMSPLRFGRDEIGQVADAFEQAQRMAVAAAAREAETRAGLRTVFLDIAHRSQAIVHRQLKVLDQAERAQEDPDQLALLFQLDHLSTRARRNAENLIILGGGQAGRQWRNPVPMIEITRSAISEAEDYLRVQIASLPRVALKGAAVADVIHLLAELVDNATNFSPPMSRVEVRGNLVGRGVVLEVEDQGLGIEPEQIEQLNQMLHDPPDFQVMALADEPRLGLFVVGQLASRHGIRVTLTPSPAYGGTRVVVLLPNSIIASDSLVDLPRGQVSRGGAPERTGPGGTPDHERTDLPSVPEPRALGFAPGLRQPLAPSSSSTVPTGLPPAANGTGRRFETVPSLDAIMAAPELFATGPALPAPRDRDSTDPGVTGLEVTDPGVTDLDVTGSEVTDPGVTDPNVTGLEVTDPRTSEDGSEARFADLHQGADPHQDGSDGASGGVGTLPAPQPLQPLPAPQPLQPLPASQPSQSLPAPQPLQPLPASQPSQSLPASQPLQPLPASQPSQSLPASQPSQSLPAPQPLQPLPAPQPSQSLPRPPAVPPVMPPPGRFEAPLRDTGLFEPVVPVVPVELVEPVEPVMQEAGVVDLRPYDAVRASAGATTSPSLPDSKVGSPPGSATPPEPVLPSRTSPDPGQAGGPGSLGPAPKPQGVRPELPRRTRQAHLSPRLRDLPAETAEASGPLDDLPDAELARSRFSALQRGTLRGRETDPES